MAAFDAELGNLHALRERFFERSEQSNGLDIYAKTSGLVIADDLDSLIGVYLSAGEQLFSIGASGPKEVLALVSQSDIELFRERESKQIDVHVWGEGVGHIPAK